MVNNKLQIKLNVECMSDDKELYHLFKSIKEEIPDKGFSRKVMNRLPKRSMILPFMIILICSIVGLTLTISISGIYPFMEQIFNFTLSLSQIEIPSTSSITAYIVGLILLGTTSFAIYQAAKDFL